MCLFQTLGETGAKFDTPETDSLTTDGNATLSEEILDIPVAEIETVVEPDGITDDIGWGSVMFICIHAGIVPQAKSIWQYWGDGFNIVAMDAKVILDFDPEAHNCWYNITLGKYRCNHAVNR